MVGVEGLHQLRATLFAIALLTLLALAATLLPPLESLLALAAALLSTLESLLALATTLLSTLTLLAAFGALLLHRLMHGLALCFIQLTITIGIKTLQHLFARWAMPLLGALTTLTTLATLTFLTLGTSATTLRTILALTATLSLCALLLRTLGSRRVHRLAFLLI